MSKLLFQISDWRDDVAYRVSSKPVIGSRTLLSRSRTSINTAPLHTPAAKCEVNAMCDPFGERKKFNEDARISFASKSSASAVALYRNRCQPQLLTPHVQDVATEKMNTCAGYSMTS